MKKKHRNRTIFIICIIIITFWITWTNNTIVTSRFTIQNSKIPDAFSNYKIAQISDLHNHDWKDKLINKIRKEQPDIIVITGDLVDSKHTDINTAINFIKQAKKIAPIYYVNGNHEVWLNDSPLLEKKLIDENVHIMNDTNIWIKKGNEKINLIGLQDPEYITQQYLDSTNKTIIYDTLNSLIQKDYYNIVLSHRPELFTTYVKAEADLVLSGHAHGGQIQIPFIGGLIAPNQGFLPTYTNGVYHKNNTDMIVSRGLGNSIIPLRINNTPELVVITLKN